MLSQEIYSQLAISKINEVEKLLASVKLPAEVYPLYSYAIEGGRKFRSLLTIAGGKLIRENNSANLLKVACAVELVHKASLIHDDIVDNDDFRRGRLSFHKKFSVDQGIMTGDLLVGLAFKYLQKVEDEPAEIKVKCYDILGNVFSLMCIGQLKDGLSKNKENDFGEADIINSQKTGSLIGAAMEMGSTISGGTEIQNQNAYRVGNLIGQLFQLMNDYNNLIGFEKENKRIPFSDLKASKKTTATVLIYNTLKNKNAADYEKLVQNNALTDSDYSEIITSNLQNIEEYIGQYAESKIDEIKELLTVFPEVHVAHQILAISNDFKENWFWNNVSHSI